MSVDTSETNESISDSLKGMGKAGWELTSTLYIPQNYSGAGEILCSFKRPA